MGRWGEVGARPPTEERRGELGVVGAEGGLEQSALDEQDGRAHERQLQPRRAQMVLEKGHKVGAEAAPPRLVEGAHLSMEGHRRSWKVSDLGSPPPPSPPRHALARHAARGRLWRERLWEGEAAEGQVA